MPNTFSDMGAVLSAVASSAYIDLAQRNKIPTLVGMFEKRIVDTRLITFDVSIPVGAPTVAAIDAPSLYSTFPATPDPSQYSWDRYISGQVQLGQNRVYDLMKLLDADVVEYAARGKFGLQNLYQKGLTASISRILNHINSLMINGNSWFQGLDQLFSQTSYAGLIHTLGSYLGKVDNVDYYSFWRPYSAEYSLGGLTVTGNDAHGSEPATAHTLRSGANIVDALDAFDLQLQLKGRTYSTILTTPEIAVNYSGLYRSEAVYSITNGQVGRAEMGVTTPTYRGRPIATTLGLPANTIYFLDLQGVYLASLRVGGALPMDDLEPLTEAGLSFGVGALGKSGATVSSYETYSVPQLVIEDTRSINRLKIVA